MPFHHTTYPPNIQQQIRLISSQPTYHLPFLPLSYQDFFPAERKTVLSDSLCRHPQGALPWQLFRDGSLLSPYGRPSETRTRHGPVFVIPVREFFLPSTSLYIEPPKTSIFFMLPLISLDIAWQIPKNCLWCCHHHLSVKSANRTFRQFLPNDSDAGRDILTKSNAPVWHFRRR